MTIGSLFSGIGGFDLGFQRAGFDVCWQVEIEPFCRRVLEKRFPKAKRYQDIKDCGSANLSWVDVICAGVPCQDVSIAGKRAGLAGERTGLFYEFARILRELRPTWFVFENVPGLLSSNQGRDFAEILRVLMVECGYGLSWRVLDSQFFGVAQRRRRVFVVGCLGEPCPAEVLFERTGGSGYIAESEEKRTGIAAETGGGVASTLFRMRAFGEYADDVPSSTGKERDYKDATDLVVSTMSSNGDQHKGFRNADGLVAANALSASDGHHGHSSPRGDGRDNIFAVRTAFTGANGIGVLDDGSTHTLDAAGAEAVCFEPRYFTRDNKTGGAPARIAHPLRSEDHAGDSQQAVCYHENKGGNLAGADNARALRSGASHSYQFVGGSNLEHKERGRQQFDAVPAVDGAVCRKPDERAPLDADRVRDFAGLPEGMDSARYRALGNAVTVRVAEWIARRLGNLVIG